MKYQILEQHERHRNKRSADYMDRAAENLFIFSPERRPAPNSTGFFSELINLSILVAYIDHLR
jgi:hypothetical protein